MKRIGLIFSIIGLLFFPVLTLATDDLYDYYNVGDTSSENFYDDNWVGQSFIASDNYAITSIRVKIWKQGSPAGEYVYFAIRETDALHRPTGSNLTTGSFLTASLTTSSGGAWYEIVLTPYRLTKDTEYSIIAWGDGANFNDFRWRRNTASTYAGYTSISGNAGISWTTTGYENVDLMFETYGIEYTPPIVPIDNAFVLSALAYVGVVWEDFALIALFSIGLPVGFFIVKKVISITSIR